MKFILFTLFLTICIVTGQENAQTRIPQSLLECYTDPILLQRDLRMPMTINTLIDLIRKVENDPAGNNMDMRMLTIALLHRFRLDGVVQAQGVAASQNVLPFSPKGFQFYKHRVLLSSFIPGNAFTFPNASLTPLERCSLHRMLSNTIQSEIRGDEATVCNRLSQYRTHRLPRDVKDTSDVEILDLDTLNKMAKSGAMQMENDVDEEPDADFDVGIAPKDLPTEFAASQCPIEDGVVHTLWGGVSAGTLLAGIAAGLQPLNVNVNQFRQMNGNKIIENLFATTLAGDLSEASLRQGPRRSASDDINIGVGGGWNSTYMPKWYFLSQQMDQEFTDAEIRGGLDGLIIGTNIRQFLQRAPTMRLSQVLDMYYSQRGVYSNPDFRACNRRALLDQVAPQDKLEDQALSFSYALDKAMQLEGTIQDAGFIDFASRSTNRMYSYIPSNLNDLSCAATATSALSLDVDASSDVYIVLDASWQYEAIQGPLTYLINNINVSPIGSNITLMNARDGSVWINSTNYASNFHNNYNFSIHQEMPNGFELPRVLEQLRELMTDKLNTERSSNLAGANSKIALMVINTPTMSDSDLSFSIEQIRILSEQVPDLRFLYLTSGSRDRFTNLVKEPTKDIFSLPASNADNGVPQMNNLITRMKEIPRRIINPRCGSDWSSSDLGTTAITHHVTPSKINYHRVHPNYFFGLESRGAVRIQGLGFGSVNVCHSRFIELPRHSNGSTVDGVVCESVTSNTIDISLANACQDRNYIHRCEPLSISVEGVSVATSGNLRCTDRACKNPDDIRYTISVVDLGCFSSANTHIISMFILPISILLAIKSLFF